MKRPLSFRSERLLLPLSAMAFLILFSTNIFAQVGGTVYRDLPVTGTTANTYGSKEPNEVGVEGVTVTVFGTGGMSVMTAADGTWSVPGASGNVRVEFSAWPTYLQESTDGGGINTSVQFTTAPNAVVNFGLHNPTNYSETNPLIAWPTFRQGSTAGTTDGGVAIGSVFLEDNGLNPLYGTADPPINVDALAIEVGAVFGLAWDKDDKRLFASTYLKRHAEIINGLGTVYVLDYTTTPATLAHSFDLQGTAPANGGAALDFGTVCRDNSCINDPGNTGILADYELPAATGTPSVDLDAFAKVGVVGYGDCDMQEGTDVLWLVNLKQRALVSVDVAGVTAAIPAAGAVNQYIIDGLPGVPNVAATGILRPFGLTFHDGRGYLLAMNDGSISENTADVDAYVLSFDPNNMALGFTQEFIINMAYDANRFWSNDFAVTGVTRRSFMPSDIEFDAQGNMYLTFINRLEQQLGWANFQPISGGGVLVSPANLKGDIIKICNVAGVYVLEGAAGSCPQIYELSTTPTATRGVSRNNKEYFWDYGADQYAGAQLNFPPVGGRAESVTGGAAILHGADELIIGAYDPHDGTNAGGLLFTQGAQHFDLTTGAPVRGYASVKGSLGAASFGKGSGMGDVEVLTAAAPIEIGNLVWEDSDDDGVQDPGELGIAGVEIKLYKADGTTLIGTATTDANGNYIFSNDPNGPVPNAGDSHIYQIAMLMPGQSYIVRIEDVTGASKQAILSTNTLGTPNIGEGANTDINDSDGAASGDDADATVLAINIPFSGANNHTFDFAFIGCPPARCGTGTSLKN